MNDRIRAEGETAFSRAKIVRQGKINYRDFKTNKEVK